MNVQTIENRLLKEFPDTTYGNLKPRTMGVNFWAVEFTLLQDLRERYQEHQNMRDIELTNLLRIIVIQHYKMQPAVGPRVVELGRLIVEKQGRLIKKSS